MKKFNKLPLDDELAIILFINKLENSLPMGLHIHFKILPSSEAQLAGQWRLQGPRLIDENLGSLIFTKKNQKWRTETSQKKPQIENWIAAANISDCFSHLSNASCY